MMKIAMIKTVSSRESSREGAFTIHLGKSAGNTCCAHQEMEITNFFLNPNFKIISAILHRMRAGRTLDRIMFFKKNSSNSSENLFRNFWWVI